MSEVDFEHVAQMDPESREEALSQPSETDYKDYYNREQEAKKTEAELYELNSRAERVQQSHGVDDETFIRVGEELLTLKEQGRITEVITPEMITQVAANDMKVAKAQDFLSQVNDDLPRNREAVEKVVALVNANFSDEEVLAFVAKNYGPTTNAEPQDDLSKKINKTLGDDGVIAKNSSPQNDNVWNFDQM